MCCRAAHALFSRDIILAPVVEMLKWLLCCFVRTLHAHTWWVNVFNAGYSLRVSPLSARTNTKRKCTLSYLWCTAVFYHDHDVVRTMNIPGTIFLLNYTRCTPQVRFSNGKIFELQLQLICLQTVATVVTLTGYLVYCRLKQK